MKSCPTCGTAYTDDTLVYCLQDGATLMGENEATNPLNLAATLRGDAQSYDANPLQTEAPNFASAPTAQMPASALPTTLYQEPRPTARATNNAAAPPIQTQLPTQPNTTRVIAFTVVATVLLLLVGGGGVWMLFRGSRTGPNSNARRAVETDSKVANEPPADASNSQASTGKGAATNARGGEDQPGKGGRWFVILGSFPKAERDRATERLDSVRRKGHDARMVASDDYPNMKSGLWVVVMGPYTRNKADELLKQVKPTVTDAYTKSGW